jgi:site-specific DNA recombinase
LEHVEAAVEEHYKTIRFAPGFIAALRKSMHKTLADSASATRLLRQDFIKKLKALDIKEDNLLDMAAAGDLAKDKIQQRLRDIEQQRRKLQEQLDGVVDDLPAAETYLDRCLDLLQDPYRLYMTASDHTRRRLNQAIFKHLFVYNEQITGHDIHSPLAELLAADKGWQVVQETDDAGTGRAAAMASLKQHKTASPRTGGSVALVDDLLRAVNARDVCSKRSMVRTEGLEPTRSSEHRHLKPARIPISPRPQRARSYRLRTHQTPSAVPGAARPKR